MQVAMMGVITSFEFYCFDTIRYERNVFIRTICIAALAVCVFVTIKMPMLI